MWMMNEKNLLMAATKAAGVNSQENVNTKFGKRQPILIGERFGRLIVIKYEGIDKSHHRYFKCKCDCGNEKVIRGDRLKSGKARSCGCYKTEVHTIHGKTNHPLHSVWRGMKARCENPKNHKYRIYGGRGITVCEEWHDFMNFYRWAMENGYQRGLSIDRIDVNGNYCPENCRWATRKEQQNNTRFTIYIAAYGKVHTISEWADITGINRDTIYNRIYRGCPRNEEALAPLKRKATKR